MKPATSFVAIVSEGGLLPADFLAELLAPKSAVEGLTPVSYNLAEGERLNEQVNRSWNRLKGRWADFKKSIAAKPAGEPTTTETRDRWLQPIFQELGFGQRLPLTPPIEVDGRSYPVSHGWNHVPIHLVGSHVDIDSRTPGAVGAARATPHSLAQQALNASTGRLWGIVSNGLTFRLLRDNVALTRLSYVEWDLAAIFDGDLYSEFFVLWLVAHQSRFDGERADQCWLERWKKAAENKGLRALEDLYPGVKLAIAALGTGLVAHAGNGALRERLRTGQLPRQEFYRQVLRVIYRLLFLFVAEDRGLLHPPDESDAGRRARDRYRAFYAITRLRALTLHRAGTPHPDLWHVFQLVAGKLGSDAGCPELALPALGSFLWTPSLSTPDLIGALVSNRHFLEAIHALAFVRTGNVRRTVDYRNLGSEELGSVYQGLLEQHPQINADAGTFVLETAAGNERKTTGSFYTPDSLVQCLLDSALEPAIAERLAKARTPAEKEAALLSLKVCDPAVGSGHFILRAGHRIARHLARVRSGEEEPSPGVYRTALRDVIGRCLYGVDVNPMSAELCRVSLWLEALEPGKPLSFLDHHIRVGNSLLGATPELIVAGLPDEAFEEIEGDESREIDGRRRLSAAAELRKLNRRERAGFGDLFAVEDSAIQQSLQTAAAAIEALPDERPEHIRRKAEAFSHAEADAEFRRRKLVADAWCAAFVLPKTFRPESDEPRGLTQRHLNELAQGTALPADLATDVAGLTARYGFFHWHLAYPEVFAHGGFDVILGNPPWDTLSPDQREFFGKYVAGLRSLGPEEQQAQIKQLLGNPAIAAAWVTHCRELFALVHFLKGSGVYTLYAPGNLGKGDFNIYRMFVEAALRRIRPGGFAAMVVPGGLYGGANASAIRQHLFDACELRNIFGLINTKRGWFEKVDIDRFAAFAAKRGGRTTTIRTQFGLNGPEDLSRPAVEIEAQPIRELAPDTYAIPDLRNISELTTSRKMYAACPTFGERVSGQPLRHYSAELHMGGNRDLFTTDVAGLPVYEGRMIDHFDHRAKTYASGHGNSAVWIEREFGDAAKAIVPQWRVLREKIPSKLGDRCDRFRIGFGDVANPRNERSFTSTLIPPGVICGHKVPNFVFEVEKEWAYLPWLAVANSFAMDWLARCRLTAPTMSFTLLDSLPFPRPAMADELVSFVAPTVLRLVCTAPEMTPFWNRMAKLGFVDAVPEGTVPESAYLNPSTRAVVRAELDAYVAARVFHLTAQELGDLLDTFEVVRRRDEKAHGEFRTKRLILAAFAQLPAAGAAPVVQPVSAAAGAGRFAQSRVNLPEAGNYILALVGALLRHLGGECDLMKLARAYALLLPSRSHLAALAETQLGASARQWVERFDQIVDAKWFLPILRAMDNRNIVTLVERGDDVVVRLKDAKGPPTTPTVETDAAILLRALEVVSAPQLAAPMQQLVPKAPRIALREAALVPA